MSEKDMLSKIYRNEYATNSGKEIKEMFEKELKKVKTITDVLNIYKKYEIYIFFGRPLATVKNLVSDFKKIINLEENLNHKELLLTTFSLPRSYYNVINESSAEVVNERRETGAKINMSVEEFDTLVNSLYESGMNKELTFWNKAIGSRQTKESIRAYYLTAYLALVTGRRLTEILKTLKLTKFKEKIKASGILKKKGDEIQESFDLFILSESAKIILAFRELRKIVDTTKLTNRECNSKFNNIYNRFLRENILNDATFHDLRSIYAEVAFVKFGKIENFEKKDFIASILLQEQENVKPVDFYLNRAKIKE